MCIFFNAESVFCGGAENLKQFNHTLIMNGLDVEHKVSLNVVSPEHSGKNMKKFV